MTQSRSKSSSTRWPRIVIVVLFVIVALVLMRVLLPLDEWIAELSAFVEGLGPWGPIAFGAVYVIATVLMAPGSLLTLAAGAIFPLWIAVPTVWLGATTGAACAFLIGRHFARARVERIVSRNPRFGAVDRAIAEGGWKIVALLRLSPAVPFNVQNYLYGLTSIRFWPCVLTSWIAMLPGTFMYVYIGYLGRQGVESVAGRQQAASAGRWALLIVGLLATVVVTVYITKLARRQLELHTSIERDESLDSPEAQSLDDNES